MSVGPRPISRQYQTCSTQKRKGTVPATVHPGCAKWRLASELMQFISNLLYRQHTSFLHEGNQPCVDDFSPGCVWGAVFRSHSCVTNTQGPTHRESSLRSQARSQCCGSICCSPRSPRDAGQSPLRTWDHNSLNTFAFPGQPGFLLSSP